jgi:hypothetical protein
MLGCSHDWAEQGDWAEQDRLGMRWPVPLDGRRCDLLTMGVTCLRLQVHM